MSPSAETPDVKRQLKKLASEILTTAGEHGSDVELISIGKYIGDDTIEFKMSTNMDLTPLLLSLYMRDRVTHVEINPCYYSSRRKGVQIKVKFEEIL